MDGFYLIDKPLGITSFDVLRVLKKKLQIKKMWHTGTLDPLASGALLVAVGNYTKLIPYFEKDSKTYEFVVNFEGTTDTLDKEWVFVPASWDALSEAQKYYTSDVVQKLLQDRFTGEILQVPPKYSALKINGKKALDLVRQWVEFEMKARGVTIHSIEILDYKFPNLRLQACVSAGTYVRTIAWDLGEIFQTWAYVTELRRTKIGNLDVQDGQKLDDFDSLWRLNDEKIFPKHAYLELDEENLNKINHGMEIQNLWNLPENQEFFIKNEKNVTNVVKSFGLTIKPIRKI